jgi:hypothetical protein
MPLSQFLFFSSSEILVEDVPLGLVQRHSLLPRPLEEIRQAPLPGSGQRWKDHPLIHAEGRPYGPGVNLINLLFFVTEAPAAPKEFIVLPWQVFFQPRLTCAGKARACPSGAPMSSLEGPEK